jgi:hypothetical protein
VFVSLILETPTPNARGKLIAFLVQVCDILFEMRSFHGFMLILSALQSNPIHRLKKSWAHAYTFSYTIERGDSIVTSDRSVGSESAVSTAVKDGYARMLAIAGIGGRNLPQVVHKSLSELNSSSEGNFGEDSHNHR